MPIFYGLKFVMLMAGFFIGGGTLLWMKGFSQNTLIWVGAVSGLCFWLPDIVLGYIAQKPAAGDLPGPARRAGHDDRVRRGRPGPGPGDAQGERGDEERLPVLAAEFTLTNFHLQMGRTRAEALHELGMRTGVADLRSLGAVLIQADKFGSSIAQALRVQSESMRCRRRQLAEEKAAKTAVKLLFPLVLFIFPGIFVVLVGPAAITMMRQMFPKMHERRIALPPSRSSPTCRVATPCG